MEDLYKLKDSLMDSLGELDTIKGGKLKMGELEALNYITDTIKNIDKICMLEEDGGYSQRGSYDGGNSYANRGKHYVRGHYSRDGEMSMARRDDRGRYSRDGGRENMIRKLRDMMDDASTDQERSAIRRCIEQMEND